MAAIVACIVLLYDVERQAAAGQAAESRPRPALTVTLEDPQTIQWENTIVAEGVIEPWQELLIGAQTSGLPLAEVRANVGDMVRRGELLARFDAALLHAEADQLEAALMQARAAARQAATVRDRTLALVDSDAVSRQEAQQAQTQAEISEAQVRLVQAQLAAKRQLLRYAEVRAPDDGVVSARSATPGSVASTGQELFRIIRQRRLEWRGELTPVQLGQVRAGQPVALTLPGGGSATAVIRQSAPRLDGQTRLATVYADLPANSRANAGMYATGRIVLGNSSALVVHSHSVVVRDGRSWLFVVDPGALPPVAKAVQVTVGRRQGVRIEILSKLPSGALVVGQGAAFLKDGDEVQVVPANRLPAERQGVTS